MVLSFLDILQICLVAVVGFPKLTHLLAGDRFGQPRKAWLQQIQIKRVCTTINGKKVIGFPFGFRPHPKRKKVAPSKALLFQRRVICPEMVGCNAIATQLLV